MQSNNSNQNLFINNEMVSGISRLDLSYDTNIIPSFAIDDSEINYLPSQPIRANLALSMFSNENDIFINYTGVNTFSGRLEYGDRYILFQSGALNSYQIRYSKYEPIESVVTAVIYGEVGRLTGNYNIQNYSQKLPIYNFHYVDIDLDEFNSNLADSFELNVVCNRNEIYEIGSYLPTDIQLIYPLAISLNCNIEIDEFNYENIRNIIDNPVTRNININFKTLNGNNIAKRINLNNLMLMNKNLSLNNDSAGTASLSFVTYIVSGIS